MSEFEAVGDVIAGAGLARVVEPKTGEADGHTHEANCLNCGTALVGSYCHVCGQHSHVHRTIGAFFHDLVHGVFHFEGKIWRTLPLLAWRPGLLTRRYIEGQRASFVSPIALFLFSVFLMFAVFSLIGGSQLSHAKDKIAVKLRADTQKLAQLEAERAALAKAGKATDDMDERIDGTKDEIDALTSANEGNLVTTDSPNGLPGWLGKSLKKVRSNPDLVAYKLKTNAYKFSWAIIPLSVPFVWLLFPFNRRFKLYDHTVFVTYSLSFMSMLATIGGGTITGLLVLIPPVHIYRHLQETYGLTWAGTLWRTLLLLLFAAIALSLFASILFSLGLME